MNNHSTSSGPINPDFQSENILGMAIPVIVPEFDIFQANIVPPDENEFFQPGSVVMGEKSKSRTAKEQSGGMKAPTVSEQSESSTPKPTAAQSDGKTPKLTAAQAKAAAVKAMYDSVGISPEDIDTDEWVGKLYKDPKHLSLMEKTVCFHNLNAKGEPISVCDARIYKYLTHTQHIITVGKLAYIYQNGYYAEDIEETILPSLIADCILERFLTSAIVARIHRMFFQKAELTKRPEELNQHRPWHVNFKNAMFNVRKWELYPHMPRMLSINQIPWEFDPNADPGPGTEIEKFLSYSVPEADDREMLLQYIGLCFTTDVSQQKMLVICGEGGTGKSTLINLIQDVIGARNISNVSLNELAERFKPILLMGKLLNSCADLEIDALDDVSMTKKLVGEDKVDGEHKGLRPVSFNNYSKLLFSTNELPLVRNEKTQGFFRRLLVLTMDKEPQSKDPELKYKLRKEIPYLIHISMQALRRMYEQGGITISENSKKATRQLRMDSDTVAAFLEEWCIVTKDEKDKVDKTSLFDKYSEYCKETERQAHTKTNFFKALRNKRFHEGRTSKARCFCGLRLKEKMGDYEVERFGKEIIEH